VYLVPVFGSAGTVTGTHCMLTSCMRQIFACQIPTWIV